MSIAYIGTLNEGGTCLMRGQVLEELLPEENLEFIDTRIKFRLFNRVLQSIAFRYKIGPQILMLNSRLKRYFKERGEYTMIWIDKAIYISPGTTRFLKNRTSCLVHFTPDTAFLANRSRHFFGSLKHYDFIVTTKSFDMEYYKQYIPGEKVILVTQGFDARYHKEYMGFAEKDSDIVFVGLYEAHREKLIQCLLDNDLSVKLAGYNWEGFVKKNSENRNLNYLGRAIGNEEYGRLISSARFSPGMLSKRFPELHTTRTFEIPACGTALLTELNEETGSFFSEDEAVFYDDLEELVRKIKYYAEHPDELQRLTEAGRQRTVRDGRSYTSILKNILVRIACLNHDQ